MSTSRYVRELEVRYKRLPVALPATPNLNNPREAAALSAEVLADSTVEKVISLHLTVKHRLIGVHIVSVGTLDSSLVHPREVFKAAFLANASGLILAHNHPSGDPTPSAEAVSTNFSVVRVRRDLLRRSSIGAIFTNRSASTQSPVPGSNQAYGLDVALAFFDNLAINSYWAQTRTPGLAGRNASYSGDLGYSGDRYGVVAEHLFIDRRFSPEVGFLRRDDIRRSFGSVRFSPRPQAIDAIRKVTWEGAYTHITDASGFVETREPEARFGVEFENGDDLNAVHTRTYDFLKEPFSIADGIAIPVGGYDFYSTQVGYTFGSQRRLSGRLSAERGAFYGGTKTTIAIGGSGRGPSGGGRIELTPQLSLEPGLSLNWIDLPQGSFTTTLVTTRATYTMTPRMFVSALTQYASSDNALSTNVRFRWEYQPGSELFVVYNEQRDTLTKTRYPDLESRTFVIKMNRLFRF